MNKVIFTGTGAAPGVPSLSSGWGKCDESNPKNERMRVGTYIEYQGLKLLIDTSPDLRRQLLNHDIKKLNGVLYTHAHADHINGIDDLREINRISHNHLNIYGNKDLIKTVKKRFDYLIVNPKNVGDVSAHPSLVTNVIKANKPFYLKGVKITPLKLKGHNLSSIGYCFDDGDFVHISDFKELTSSALKAITKRPKVMVMPLTTMNYHRYHANLEVILKYNDIIKPEKLIINHMSTDCDYDTIKKLTPKNTIPAYDGLEIEF